jgi:hypothetical protein
MDEDVERAQEMLASCNLPTVWSHVPLTRIGNDRPTIEENKIFFYQV